MKFSTQATGALLMTLQKCLIEETDIVELLNEWDLESRDGEIFVLNPPVFSVSGPDESTVFEIPKGV
jgi:hypothetical protein